MELSRRIKKSESDHQGPGGPIKSGMETTANKTGYPSDLNEPEWAILNPLIPRPPTRARGEVSEAHDPERDLLSGAKRVRMTDAVQRPAAVEKGLALFFPLEKAGRMGAAQRRSPGCRPAPSG